MDPFLRKIEARQGSLIDSLTFTFGNVKAALRGGTSGAKAPDCVIKEGDVITRVRLREAIIHGKPFIQRLEFLTRGNTVCDFGYKSSFTRTLSYEGYHLSHVSGANAIFDKGIVVINGLQFYWKKTGLTITYYYSK